MRVGSLSNYIKALDTFKPEESYERFYRGQSQENWPLIPSIFRPQYSHLKDKESTILRELQIHYPDSFEGCCNMLEKLVLAQHYDIPTRLLDITTNPLIALYFACHNKQPHSGDAKVFIIDIPKKDIVYFDNNEMLKLLESSIEDNNATPDILCVKVRLNNPRIIKQNGAFLLFLNDNETLKELNIRIESITIANTHIKTIVHQLRLLGISTEAIFPELTKYAEVLKNGTINL